MSKINDKPIIVALRTNLNDGNNAWFPNGFQDICLTVVDLEDLLLQKEGYFVKKGYNCFDESLDFEQNPRKVTVILNFTTHKLSPCSNCVIYGSPDFSEWIDNKLIQKLIISDITSEPRRFYGSISSSLIPKELLETTLKDLKPLEELKFDLTDRVQVLKAINTNTKSGEDVHFVTRDSDIGDIIESNALCLLEEFIECSSLVSGGEDIKHRLRIYAFQGKNGIKIGPPYLTRSKSNNCNGDTSILRLYQPTISQNEEIERIVSGFLSRLKELYPNANTTCKDMFYGFDFVIDRNERVRFIEINNHDSLGLRSVAKFELPIEDEALGAFHNQLVEDYFDIQMKDKIVLVIGYGSYSKKNLFDWLHNVGAKIIVADSEKPPLKIPYEWIKIPIHSIEESSTIILNYFSNSQVDSVVSLYEDYIPLKHRVQGELKKLGLHSSPYPADFENSILNKDKVSVYSRINTPSDLFEDYRQYFFAPQYYCINSVKDIELYTDGFPVILKYSTASSAFGCKKVNSKSELIDAYLDLVNSLENCDDSDGVGVQFDYEIFVSDWVSGTEHDVDIILNNGEVLLSVVSDNTEVDPKNPRETGVTMPTKKYSDLEVNQITLIVRKVLLKLGLSHGVFNVEFIDTPLGPKIIDVNPRPGGYYINEYIQFLYGIDTFKAEVLLNSNIDYRCFPLITSYSLEGKAVYSHKDIAICDRLIQLTENLHDTNGIDMIACATNVVHQQKGITNPIFNS